MNSLTSSIDGYFPTTHEVLTCVVDRLPDAKKAPAKPVAKSVPKKNNKQQTLQDEKYLRQKIRLQRRKINALLELLEIRELSLHESKLRTDSLLVSLVESQDKLSYMKDKYEKQIDELTSQLRNQS
jgi:hypothetical protein